jgi:hypothetical protein
LGDGATFSQTSTADLKWFYSARENRSGFSALPDFADGLIRSSGHQPASGGRHEFNSRLRDELDHVALLGDAVDRWLDAAPQVNAKSVA